MLTLLIEQWAFNVIVVKNKMHAIVSFALLGAK